MAVELSNEELNSMNSAVLKRYNIDFTHYEPKSFKRRVSKAIDTFGMSSFFELWTKLLKERDFLFDFIDAITVGMTSIFRDPKMWKVMKNDVLRQLKDKPQIKIWHAACSTGEEVYSMGIVMKDLGLLDKSKVLATDLNRNSVETARNGVFESHNLRQYTKQFSEYNTFKKFETYYSEDGKKMKMNPELAKNATFKVHNMIHDKVTEKFDIIFCRNVMIYFDENLKVRLLQEMHNHLNPGGFFVIGFFDALIPLIDNNLFEHYNLEAKIFKKVG